MEKSNEEEIKKEQEVKKEETKKEETQKEEVDKTKDAQKTASDIKNEAVETVKQVKEKMKDVDIKEEAKAAQGFVTKLVKDPLGEIEDISNDNENKNFKTAIVLVIIWTLAAVIISVFSMFDNGLFKYFGSNALRLLKTLLTPSLMVLATSLSVFVLNSRSSNKKSLITIITTITTTYVPVIIVKVLNILALISSNVYIVTNRISTIATALTFVMQFFAVKSLLGEKENKSAFVKFAIVEAIYAAVSLVLYFLGISI